MTGLTVSCPGLACPLGLSSEAAVAALRAGVSRMNKTDLVRDLFGEDVLRTALDRIPPKATRTERILFMGAAALKDTVGFLARSPETPIPVYLALPTETSSAPIDLRAVAGLFADTSQWQVSRRRFFRDGRAGFFSALLAAVKALQAGDHDTALVGGVDSLVDPESLRALSKKNALLGRGNPGGRVPAEGAAFVLLSSGRALASSGPRSTLVGCTTGQDPQPRTGDQPNTGIGLTSVFRSLRQSFPARVDEIYAAETGELHSGREFSYAYLRNTALMPEPLELSELGTTLGDAGAGSGAIAMIRALCSLHRPRDPRKTALAYASSDAGLTGACIVSSTRERVLS